MCAICSIGVLDPVQPRHLHQLVRAPALLRVLQDSQFDFSDFHGNQCTLGIKCLTS